MKLIERTPVYLSPETVTRLWLWSQISLFLFCCEKIYPLRDLSPGSGINYFFDDRGTTPFPEQQLKE